MTLERFEEELHRRVDAGKMYFIGMKTGTVYQIYKVNGSDRKHGWSLFGNGRIIKARTNFFAVTCEIWDREKKEG